MTPQFTTPCYIRIDDAQQRKEVCEKLEQMEYSKMLVWYDEDDSYIKTSPALEVCGTNDYAPQYYTLNSIQSKPYGLIYCDSIPLFLDLAGMRKDTDKGQLFINESLGKMFRCKDGKFASFYVDWKDGLTNIHDGFRRATPQEIINHHKQKGEKE